MEADEEEEEKCDPLSNLANCVLTDNLFVEVHTDSNRKDASKSELRNAYRRAGTDVELVAVGADQIDESEDVDNLSKCEELGS